MQEVRSYVGLRFLMGPVVFIGVRQDDDQGPLLRHHLRSPLTG